MQITTSWREQGQVSLIMRQVKHKFGDISSELIEEIQNLNSSQLKDLGEVLLDSSSVEDLRRWLSNQR